MNAFNNPLSHPKFISYLIAGLNSEYDAFVTSITTRLESLSPEELYGLLFTNESCLSHPNHLPTSTNFSTNYTLNNHGRDSTHDSSMALTVAAVVVVTPLALPPLLPHKKTTFPNLWQGWPSCNSLLVSFRSCSPK